MKATLMECATLTVSAMRKIGREPVAALLTKYGAKNIAALKDEQRLPFMEELNKIVSKHSPTSTPLIPRAVRTKLIEELVVFMADASPLQLRHLAEAALSTGAHPTAGWSDLKEALDAFIAS